MECKAECDGSRSGRTVRIRSDSGRFVRPLRIVSDGVRDHVPHDASLLQLLIDGQAEMVDSEVFYDRTKSIAEDLKDLSERPHQPSHVEFHPALTLGVFASSIPFAHHNQVGRVPQA